MFGGCRRQLCCEGQSEPTEEQTLELKMKYVAHMQSGQYADTHFDTEFEVSAAEVEGLDGDALDTYLNNKAVDALAESGLIAIWFEEA